MKLRNTIIIALSIIFPHAKADVRGVVLDENKLPIAGATVIASCLSDSSYVDGLITGADGRFNINTSLDEIAIKVSYLGYETVNMLATESAENQVQLHPDAKALNEVTVIADAIKYKAGGYTFRPSEALSEGKEAPQLLAYLPGITEEEGAISVLSRAPAAIYIDGIRIANQSELKSIAAPSMQSIDVSFIAGAGELTSSGGAIIRIKLRKNVDKGYSGYLKGETELMPDYGYRGEGATGYISGRYGKLSLSNHLYYKRSKMISDNKINYTPADGDNDAEISRLRGWAPYVYDRLNLTYELSQKHSIGVSGLLSHSGRNNNINSESQNSSLTSSQSNDRSSNSVQAVANYTWAWDASGSGLYVTGDYLHIESCDSLEITDISTPLKSSEQSGNNLYSAKIESKFKAIRGNMTAGAGYKGADFNVDVKSEPMTYMKTHRPYLFASYQGMAGMLNYEIGMRYQWNRMNVGKAQHSDQNRFNGLCPSVSLVYLLNPMKGHMIMFNYERALDDIPYSAISTYRHYITPVWYETGNSSISTPVNDNIMAVLSLFSKFTLSMGAYLSKDQIYYATEDSKAADGNILIVTSARNGRHQSMGFGQVEYELTAGKWMTSKPYVSWSAIWASTPDYNVSNQSKWKIGVNNTLRFGNAMGATINGYWESAYGFLDMKMKSVASINGSIYKNFSKNKLQLKAEFTLWRKGRTVITHGAGVAIEDRNFTRTPLVALSARWNFKGGKKVSVKNNTAETQQSYQYSNPGNNR